MGVCLLIHGFTGTPFEVEPLAKELIHRGHQVIMPTLAGHGNSRHEMGRVTWRDWIRSAEGTLRDLLKQHPEEKIHLVGFSMGGLIAAYLSIEHRERIASLTMLAAPVFTINPKQLFRTIAEAIQKSMRARDRHEDVTRYIAKVKGTPLRSLVHFRRLIQEVKPKLEQLEVPLFVIQGELDDLVEPRSAAHIFDSAASPHKDLHFFSQSGHMICHDCEAEVVCRRVADFIERNSGESEGKV
ncbi:alpha/beta hydrolase [Tumebacillus lipolyticus]|uniref:Alpha/beta hydrolase n=1 Tax=Tumebacillus lipolyticus TaxID=1280370 RepID=A0ABW5A101_9BACL